MNPQRLAVVRIKGNVGAEMLLQERMTTNLKGLTLTG